MKPYQIQQSLPRFVVFFEDLVISYQYNIFDAEEEECLIEGQFWIGGVEASVECLITDPSCLRYDGKVSVESTIPGFSGRISPHVDLFHFYCLGNMSSLFRQFLEQTQYESAADLLYAVLQSYNHNNTHVSMNSFQSCFREEYERVCQRAYPEERSFSSIRKFVKIGRSVA